MGRKKSAASAKGGKVAKKAKRGGRGGGGAAAAFGEAPGRKDRRKQQRKEARQAPAKRAHGGDDARVEQRERMRAKALERRLSRLDGTVPSAERCTMLKELGHLQMDSQRTKFAVDSFQQILRLQPEDPGFARGPLLCALMDQAKTQEASDLLKGPLFERLLASVGVSAAAAPQGKKASAAKAGGASVEGAEAEPVLLDLSSGAAGRALTIGCYTLALLTYISVRVLEEHGRNPNKAAAAEQRLLKRLLAAKKTNAFIAEYLAFAPAFEPHFAQGADLPPADSCPAAEQPLLEALEYCCRYRQAAIWMDTDEEVRRFLRATLFEEEEEAAEAQPGAEGEPSQGKGDKEEPPPFGVLPEPAQGESALLSKWRKARDDALELWATEMSVEGGSGPGEAEEAEDEGEEESDGDESSMDSAEAMAALEERLNMG